MEDILETPLKFRLWISNVDRSTMDPLSFDLVAPFEPVNSNPSAHINNTTVNNDKEFAVAALKPEQSFVLGLYLSVISKLSIPRFL